MLSLKSDIDLLNTLCFTVATEFFGVTKAPPNWDNLSA